MAAGKKAANQPPVAAEPGWKYRIAFKNLPGIDNIVAAPDGSLYATQELAQAAGKVIRIHRGQIKTVLADLDRADGLLMRGKFLYITEETNDGRVLEFNLTTKTQKILATLRHPEGIDMLADGNFVVAEDNVNGRLVRVLHDGGEPVEVILGGLNRPEGVTVDTKGQIIFAETATGRVLAYKDGEINVIVDDLDEPDQVELAPDGALWISEDVNDGRLLRLKDGTLETVLSGLRSPQGIAFGSDGTIWLAERGRQRILAITAVNE
ncbi:MAG: hypothetical protein HY081_05885 [Gammaproteobacteria bacterium]|nr:hypothetical protein [Gammaproteobacteria bacterium]